MTIYSRYVLSYFRQRDRGWILSLFAAVSMVYLPFLGNPFVFDDIPFFLNDAASSFATADFYFSTRWLPYASLGWTYAIFSDVLTHIYHLGNMLLHAATVIALFYLLRQLMVAVIPDSKNLPQMIWGAWLAAIIFAVHPVAVYAVGYIIQRSILMTTLFVLLMQLAYLRGLLTGQWRWLLLAVLAYILAGLSKEHSLLAPALLVAETILLRGQIMASARSLWLTWGALAAVGVKIMLLAKGVFGVPYEIMATNLFAQQGLVESTPMLHALSVLTQAGLFFKYLWLWLLPNPAWMSIDMREPFVATMAAWQSWLGAAGFVVYGVLGGWLLFRPRWAGLFGLALLYPWLLFPIEFSSIRVQEPFVLYRSYLWMPGIMLLFPLFLAQLPGRKPLLVLGLVALLLVLPAWNRLWVFADNYRLWNDAALLLNDGQAAGADRIFYNRGKEEAASQKWSEAKADYKRAVGINPTYAPYHYALGTAYFDFKLYNEALAQFDECIVLKKDEARYYFAKGVTLKHLHEDVQALRQIEKSCELDYVVACLIIKNIRNK